MKITACPKCGSTHIFQGTMSDGTITGITTRQVCRECGYQGPPLIFESEEEYQRFRQELSADKEETAKETTPDEDKQSEEEPEELTKEDKEIAALIEETEACPEPPHKSSYLRELLLAVLLSILFFIIIIGGRYFGMYTIIPSHTDLVSILLYLLGSFIGVLIFFFLLIVFIETLSRGIRFRKTTKR
jgi:transcription elongation factor Elf1